MKDLGLFRRQHIEEAVGAEHTRVVLGKMLGDGSVEHGMGFDKRADCSKFSFLALESLVNVVLVHVPHDSRAVVAATEVLFLIQFLLSLLK